MEGNYLAYNNVQRMNIFICEACKLGDHEKCSMSCGRLDLKGYDDCERNCESGKFKIIESEKASL